ncbi:KGGVGR-motif variant AAA ATPase [Variovorax sp. GT1P44]|uniref:KGGVGR-motif variant AAA ATPase n=1 Tax=Variovorax sp. GT1P44 TaxID=3443742 RepID=UPI003F45F74E
MTSAAPARTPGSIITFYSYKGGTGRTMALANTACVLAERVNADAGEKVLVVDWDLEAPGLHQFLPARLRSRGPAIDTGLGAERGLIDLFIAIREALPEAEPASADEAEEAAETAMSRIDIGSFIGDTEVPNIHIIRAGRNDDGLYSRRVNTFDWEGLFKRAPGIYRRVAEALGLRYRYVLVDSRTGVTDISGICTSLLPEKLVVVFTPNRQSLTGVRELVVRATSYRLGSDDLRPLLVYPLPSRIEVSMERLNAHWRYGNLDAGVAGYQPMFQNLLKDCYALKNCDLGAYFDDVQIQQSADVAYGEVISVRQMSSERLSLANSYRVFVERLLADIPPWMAQDSPVTMIVPRGSAPITPPTSQGPSSVPASAGFGTPPVPPPMPGSTVQPGTAAPGLPPSGGMAAEDPFADLPPASVVPPSPTVSKGKRVFISYAPPDIAQAQKADLMLRQHGYEVFLDRDIKPGVSFQGAIADALDASDVVIVLWSKASVGSDFVKLEASEGGRRGVLVPVLLDGAYPPLEYRSYQAIDLSRDSRRDWDALLSQVESVAGRKFVSPPGGAVLAPAPRSMGWWGLLAAIGASVVVLAGWQILMSSRTGQHGEASYPSTTPNNAAQGPNAVVPVVVPDFAGLDVRRVVQLAQERGLGLVVIDAATGAVDPTPPPPGSVIGQLPVPGSLVTAGTRVNVRVGTSGPQEQRTVPSVPSPPPAANYPKK